MAFKSYSWSIGTTSFRVSQLNYKVERQLQLLKEFWKKHPNEVWTNNEELQEKYYLFLKKNNFVKGDASRKAKDAREKTSGLVNIGVITSDRKLTEVGLRIESLLDKPRTKNNIFYIDNDSYDYLLQFLKLQIYDKNNCIAIRPFIALIYMIEKLGYVTYDEFTYLLPLCKNKYDVVKMTNTIKNDRKGIILDDIIVSKIYEMNNYLEAELHFRNSVPVTEKTMEEIGMNRKSKAYDHPYLNVYNELINLVFHLRKNTFEERKQSYINLYNYCKKISGKAEVYWLSYLFMEYNIKKIDEEFDKKFRSLDISTVKNIIDFKRVFFERMHIIKWKVNLKEYFDLNKRYFSLTDIIKFEDDKIELDLLPKFYFENIIDDLLNENVITDEEKYIKLFHSHIKITDISDKYSDDIESLIEKVNAKLNTNLNITNINNYLEDKRLKEFNKLIDSKFKDSDIIRLLEEIKNRQDEDVENYVTTNADVPTIFEYILGIAWYKISERKGNILKFMNLSLDADLLPKTHAGGGMADIVYSYDKESYPKHNLLIEATVSESTGQRSMEMEPVSRHLGEDINNTNNDNDYALFVATKLEERVILDFRSMRTRFYPKKDGSYINGLKIIPIDSDMLIKIINKELKYKDIYNWFDTAYKSKTIDPEWYKKEILENV